MSRKKPPKKLQAVPPKSFQPPEPIIGVLGTDVSLDSPGHTYSNLRLPMDPLGEILRQQLQQGEEYRRQTPRAPTP
jgi:hypothetical protein